MMVPTWTRFVPKHYDITAKSPAPLPDQVSQQPFPFMGLPLEIRLQIYRTYLHDRYSISPAKIHEMVLDPSHRTKRSAEILQVNKAINAEVKDVLQQENTSNYEYAGKTLHLMALIKIYPPHEDRPTDMVHLWRYIYKLCEDLSKVPCFQQISIYFLENEYAAWSLNGKPREIMGVKYDSDHVPSDILHIIDLFKTVTRAKKSRIYLPVSLNNDVGLQEVRQQTEELMVKIEWLDEKHQEWMMELVHLEIDRKVSDLR